MVAYHVTYQWVWRKSANETGFGRIVWEPDSGLAPSSHEELQTIEKMIAANVENQEGYFLGDVNVVVLSWQLLHG